MDYYSIYFKTLCFICLIFVIAFGIVSLIASGGGGSNDNNDSSSNTDNDNDEYVYECEGENVYGPAGGTVEVTDTNSVFYGLSIVIPAGALDDCRSFSIDEWFFISDLPNGCIAYPDYNAQFGLSTGGDEPYDLELEFYFPVNGMTVEPGELACAFGYDERTGKWNIIMPDSINDTTMAVKTNYHDAWMWGKIIAKLVDEEYLIPVIDREYGTGTYDAFVAEVEKLNSQLQDENFTLTCTNIVAFKDGFLENTKNEYKEKLDAYQSQIYDCGDCDIFTEEFIDELYYFFQNYLNYEVYSFYEAFGPEILICDDMLLLALKQSAYSSMMKGMDCSLPCITDTVGGQFWVNYAIYFLADYAQGMISFYMNTGEYDEFGC